LYLSQLRQSYWELRGLGVELVAAANDTPETNRELRERLDLPFTLLSDPEAAVAAAYGAFHDNEPSGRSIARVSMLLIAQAEAGGQILWEYVGPSSRHRVAPSRLSEEIQRALGRERLLVNVVVPSAWQVERTIASFQEPPLGLYRTPDDLNEPGVKTYRDYTRELAMQSYAEVQRLTEAGWTLVAVTPELEGSVAVGQRYVFTRDA
jgi:hypothetical protein